MPPPARLNGWKEIAAYFGKGVRTVQRWEKDLGLPVRRISSGRGEVVYVLVAELDAWEAAALKRDDLAARPGEDEAGDAPTTEDPHATRGVTGPPFVGTRAEPWPARRAGVVPRAAVAAVILLLGAAACVVVWRSFRSGQPYEARIENHALRVYDERGRFLWEHRFEFSLSQTREAPTPLFIDDIDGDGTREVVLATSSEPMTVAHGVYVFDHEGDLRFRHSVRAVTRYGDVPATGPWHPVALAVVPDGAGRQAIWVSSCDRDQFPCVVEKIDADNRVLGEFWHPGVVDQIVPGTYDGRPVVLLGASSNEFNGAALAVVDRERPTGTAPAVLAKFVCHGCPAGQPLAYVVFPGTELERLQDNTCGVEWIHRGERGALTVVVLHHLYFDRFGRGDGLLAGRTHFILDAALRPLSGQHQPDFRVMHDEAFRRQVLDHRFGPADEAAMWPLLRWNGTRFEELRLTRW